MPNSPPHFGRHHHPNQLRQTNQQFNIISHLNQEIRRPSEYMPQITTNHKGGRSQSTNHLSKFTLITHEKSTIQKPDNYDSLKQHITDSNKNLINIQSQKYDIITNKERMNQKTSSNINYQDAFYYKNQVLLSYFKPLFYFKSQNYFQTVSKIIDANHTYNPHLRPAVKTQTDLGFFKRRNGDCNNICEMQKSYGVKNIFRKYK